MGGSLRDRVSLNNDIRMPTFGFGTAEVKGKEVEEAVRYALEMGYRMVDTSPSYGNEVEVGNGVRQVIEQGLMREDIFVVTKVEPEDMTAEKAAASVDASLERLGLDYVDMVLIHTAADDDEVNIDTWKGLEEAQKSGKTKSIGVSNFTKAQLEPLLQAATVKPTVIQNEMHPGYVDWETKTFCDQELIITMAYSPLDQGGVDTEKTLIEIGETYGKSPQQVALRWVMQKRAVPIPRSSKKEHIEENAAIFDFRLTDEEMAKIDELT